jgi:hypothetical protein
LEELSSRKIVSSVKGIPEPKVMEPIVKMDFEKFRSKIKLETGTVRVFNIKTELLNLTDIEMQR